MVVADDLAAPCTRWSIQFRPSPAFLPAQTCGNLASVYLTIFLRSARSEQLTRLDGSLERLRHCAPGSVFGWKPGVTLHSGILGPHQQLLAESGNCGGVINDAITPRQLVPVSR